MEAAELSKMIFERNAMRMIEALEGLDDEDLAAQPKPHANPVGWLVWHATRTVDLIAARLSGEEQVWISGGWRERMKAPFGDRDSGFGHSMDQVRALQATKADLIGYLKATEKHFAAATAGLTAADLDKEVDHYREGRAKVAELLTIVAGDFNQHTGQVAYLRGFMKGMGWRT